MEEAVAVVAAHLGVVNEDDINNMSIPFFNDVLSALGRKLNYESISNLYGNSFCKDANKYITEAYPLAKPNKLNNGFMGLISKAVKGNKPKTTQEKKQEVKKALGETDWAEGLFDF